MQLSYRAAAPMAKYYSQVLIRTQERLRHFMHYTERPLDIKT